MKNILIKSVVGRRQRFNRYLLKPLCLLAFGFGLQTSQGAFSLPLYENFAYTNNEPLGAANSSALNWGWGNSASGSSSHPHTNASLSYIGMPVDTTPIPNGTTPGGLLANTGTGKVRGANFSNPVTNVTVYASFLLNVRSLVAASTDRLLFGLGAATTGSGANGAAGVWLDPSGRLKISKNSTTVAATNTTYPLVIGNTYLVVFRYQVNASGPDQVDLWLNPSSLGNGSTIPAPDMTTTNNANARTFNSMTFNGNAPTHVFYMDEIRVSTDWVGVTPATAWAGSTYSVTGGGVGCSGASFVIGLNGSDLGVDYLLHTNGVFAGVSVAGTGSPVDFGAQSFTATYTVLATNAADSTVHWMNGNGVVGVSVPPVITSQPAPVSAAANSSVAFLVSASGSGLNYQWYRNGVALANGGSISGVATPALIISPATAADVATAATGYYCIISTLTCGYSVTSVTNDLTLQAPGNIVWQGTPTNLWDISTTANWTNSAGAAVVFNPGDNVILDDSFQNPVLSLQSPYVSPGLISYVGSLNMAVNGSGNTIGNGNIFGLNSSLLVNGTGMLSISNANDFAGGSTVSNGMLSVSTFAHPVGYGPVTLAGGIFRVAISGANTAAVLSNSIVVVADSTLQYDGTGGNALNFAGTLSGVVGKTLTISNNSIASTLNWVRLLKGFTNDANIVLGSPGAAIEITPVLNAGNQVFNGTISGNFGRLRPTGGSGSLILNAQNTHNDMDCFGTTPGNGRTGISLYMSGGNANVGFGADSVSTTPPTIDASPAGTGNIGINVGSDGGNCGFFASGGAHTVGNPIVYTSATNTVTVSIVGNNDLTLSGPITLSGADGSGPANRTFAVTNTGLTTFSGVIDDGSLGCGLTKTANGTLALSAVNTYTGPTVVGGGKLWVNGQIGAGGVTVTNGVLGGSGAVTGDVTVNAPGSIGGGAASIGTLAINGNLTLAGNGWFRLNKSLAQSNDVAQVDGTLANTGTGTITVTNIGVPAVAIGDTFQLFNKAVANGNTLTIVGAGMTWTNQLAIDGSIQALSLAIANYPTNISYSLSGGSLNITWPTTHLGWILQCQTNDLSVGLSSAWFDIASSASMTSTNLPVNPANPTVFYRLRHP